MIITKLKNGLTKIHIEEIDSYEVTNDNGVNLWLSSVDVKKLKEGL